MLRVLAALIGLGCMLGLPAQAMDHPAPYGMAKVNNIYNMLFCDDPALFKDQNGQERFGAGAQAGDVRKIAEDENEESRVRALAYNWLRARKESVPPGKLLGVIFEVPIDNGLDTLAVYADGRVRYINHTGVMSIFEGTPPEIAAGGKAIVASAATVVGSFKPSDKDRAPPLTVEVRVTLLTSDGLYVAQESWREIAAIPSSGPSYSRAHSCCSSSSRRSTGTNAAESCGGAPVQPGSKPGSASSNLANSKPGATVAPTNVQSPSDCAACQA